MRDFVAAVMLLLLGNTADSFFLPAGQATTRRGGVVLLNGSSSTSMPSDFAALALPADALDTGVVIVASPEDYGHFTQKAAAVVIERSPAATKAVVLDRGSPFTIGEMTNMPMGILGSNRLFRGGEDGKQACILLHEYDLPGSQPIGDSGLMFGGLEAAMAAVERGELPASDFKFFFNYMEYSVGALEEQVDRGKWNLAQLPNKIILSQDQNHDQELW
jgi:putative AlgH/UPF0301 family transcriptional regulator